MKRVNVMALLGVVGCAAPKADLIMRDARVITLDEARPHASAIAVRKNRIVAVGDNADVESWRGPDTRVIELSGATVLPGLTDAHAHIESLGRSLERLDLRGTKSAADVAQRVVQAAMRSTGWILGRGWDQNDWPDAQFPTAAILDEVAPGRAVLLTRVDGHATWASSEALRLAQITRETRDPAGGKILRDDAGMPTGVLIDEAMNLVDAIVPKPDRATRERWIRKAIDRAAQLGLTAVHDMGVDQAGYDIFRELALQGALKIRVYAVGAPEEAERLVEGKPESGAMLSRRAVKLVVDGALGSRGAALIEDYSDDPGNRGLIITSRERIAAVSRRALENGWQVCVHAIGDLGNRTVLDAFSDAVGERQDHRFRIEHAQVVSETDMGRFHALGVIASMQPVHWTSDSPWAPARLGADRMRGAYAWKTLVQRGTRLAFGSDFPVEEPDPRPGLAAAVARSDEGLERMDALRAFTQGAAFAAFEENQRSTIRAGMWADLTVIGGNFMEMAPSDIQRMKVLYTVVGGSVVSEATP